MTKEEKKDKIKQLVIEMLTGSHENSIAKIDVAIDAINKDMDEWDGIHSKMVLPKAIVTAILKSETHQYTGKGTCFERWVNKRVKIIKYHIQ